MRKHIDTWRWSDSTAAERPYDIDIYLVADSPLLTHAKFEAEVKDVKLVVSSTDIDDLRFRVITALRSVLAIEWKTIIEVTINYSSGDRCTNVGYSTRRLEVGVWHDGRPVYRDVVHGQRTIVFEETERPRVFRRANSVVAIFDDTIENRVRLEALLLRVDVLGDNLEFIFSEAYAEKLFDEVDIDEALKRLRKDI